MWRQGTRERENVERQFRSLSLFTCLLPTMNETSC
jgi:hypothetical protein